MKQKDVLQKTTAEIAAMAKGNALPQELVPAVMRFLGELATMPVFILARQADADEDSDYYSPLAMHKGDDKEGQRIIPIFCTDEEAAEYCERQKKEAIERGYFPWTVSAKIIETTMRRVGEIVENGKKRGLELNIAFVNESGSRLIINMDTFLEDVKEMLGLKGESSAP